MHVVNTYTIVVCFLYLGSSTSMLLPLLPPEVSNVRNDMTAARTLNNLKRSEWSQPDASTVNKNTNDKRMNFHSNVPSVTENTKYNENKQIMQSVAKHRHLGVQTNMGFDKNRWSNNYEDLQPAVGRLNGHTDGQNVYQKDSTPNENSEGLPYADYRQGGGQSQHNAGTLLQSLFKTMLRNNRKSGIRKVINNFIQKLQVIVDSDLMLTNSSHTTLASDNSHKTAFEKGDSILNREGDIQETPNYLNKDTSRKNDFQNVLKPTSKYQPNLNNHESTSTPTMLMKEQLSLDQTNKDKQKENVRKFRRGRRKKSTSYKPTYTPILNKISNNSQNQNFEDHGIKVGLTRNFERLYNRFFPEKSVKENNHIYTKLDTNKHAKNVHNHNKSGHTHAKKTNDGHKTRKMLRDLAEYTYNWNRQSSQESYDQYMHVEVINLPLNHLYD